MRKPTGRTDDMLIIRGVNVFPSQIEEVLLKVSGDQITPNYQIVLDRINNTDTFDVNVEMTPELFSDTVRGVAEAENKLVNAMRLMLGISPKVHLVAPKSITRSEGKAVRVIDKRKLHD
jgi:phenylacetate-CoA ligase